MGGGAFFFPPLSFFGGSFSATFFFEVTFSFSFGIVFLFVGSFPAGTLFSGLSLKKKRELAFFLGGGDVCTHLSIEARAFAIRSLMPVAFRGIGHIYSF